MRDDEKAWTDAEIAQLTDLWSDLAISAAEIGRRMTRSKSSIVGKASRLNLPTRASPIKRDGIRKSPPRRPRVPPLATLPTLAQEAPAADPVAPRPRPDPDSRHACCWPIGQPGTASFRFCGNAAVLGRPYCAEHRAIATVSRATLVRQAATLQEVEAYAAAHRVIVKPATGLTGLMVAVNNHRRAAGLVPYSMRQSALAA